MTDTTVVAVADLAGPALDWAVAKCEGRRTINQPEWWDTYAFSTNWAQGGLIIEREGIDLEKVDYQSPSGLQVWRACFAKDKPVMSRRAFGDTPLIAAMRCLVINSFGNELAVPTELLPKQKKGMKR